jgi:HSP20 family protein
MTNLPSIFKHRGNFVDSFDRVFDQVIAKQFPSLSDEFGVDFFSKSSYPRVDVIDYKDKIQINSEIPGLSKKDINIEVKDKVLTISGTKNDKTESNGSGTYLYKELKHSSFRRSFTLNKNLKLEDIDAKFADGILEITIPKLEKVEDEVLKINIK